MSKDDDLLAIVQKAAGDYQPQPWSAPAAPLTRATLQDAIDKINRQEITICVGSNQHLVHPEERNCWTNCAACFQMVWVGPDPMHLPVLPEEYR